MNFIALLWGKTCAALFGVAAREIRTEIEKPHTIEDANTPPEIKASADAAARAAIERLRKQAGGQH